MKVSVVLNDMMAERPAVETTFEGLPVRGKTFTFHFAPGKVSNLRCEGLTPLANGSTRVTYTELPKRLSELRKYEVYMEYARYDNDSDSAEMRQDPVGEYVKVKDVEAALRFTPDADDLASLPMASYPMIDEYMARAGAFVTATENYRQISSIVVTAVAEYMASLDGLRIR